MMGGGFVQSEPRRWKKKAIRIKNNLGLHEKREMQKDSVGTRLRRLMRIKWDCLRVGVK